MRWQAPARRLQQGSTTGKGELRATVFKGQCHELFDFRFFREFSFAHDCHLTKFFRKFSKIFAVQDHNTGGKLSTGVTDTRGKFAAVFIYTGGLILPKIFFDRGDTPAANLPTVSMMPVDNTDNSNRLQTYPIVSKQNMEESFI